MADPFCGALSLRSVPPRPGWHVGAFRTAGARRTTEPKQSNLLSVSARQSRLTPLRARRLDGLGTTVFTEMSALAAQTGAINLGQGFPDTDGPEPVIDAAIAALRAGENQYAPLPGVPALRDAV